MKTGSLHRPKPDHVNRDNTATDPVRRGTPVRQKGGGREGGDADGLTDLGGEDGEVDAGEALEVLPEEALGVVLPDLLARHGDGGREWKVGDWRWACRGKKNKGLVFVYVERDSEMHGLDGI
jgi:hypothetical protein